MTRCTSEFQPRDEDGEPVGPVLRCSLQQEHDRATPHRNLGPGAIKSRWLEPEDIAATLNVQGPEDA